LTDSPDEREAFRHALRDRALESAGRAREKPRGHPVPRAVAAMLALSIVSLVLLGFNAFLGAIRKVLDIEAADPAPASTAPVPVYVVEEPMPAAADEPARPPP
jgi:hypothetical protein